jgi:glycosyltransferase involved in cell wall biosynthesis
MRILWVKVGGLWPLDTGGRLRSFNILAELSRRHRVSVITTHAPGEDPGALRERLPRCEQVVSVPYAAVKWRSARFPFLLMRSWASALPVDLWKCVVPGLRAEVERRLREDPPDLCIADFLFAAMNVPMGGTVPVVLFQHNVEYQIWQRLAGLERRPWLRPLFELEWRAQEPVAWRRALLEIEWRKMRRYEAAACSAARLTIAVSAADRDALAANAPGAAVAAVPTGVDLDYFAPHGTAEAPARLVFIGSMDWRPNEDAVLHFIREVLPRVRREVPAATLTVVGRNPSAELRSAALAAGVEVTGAVADVRPYVAAAAVAVVPLRVGGGTRLKIFEALAMRKAVVSTSVGAEGLPVADQEHLLIADGPERFAAAVVVLLRDPSRRAALGQAGRRLVERSFSWARVAQEFDDCCMRAVA